MATATPRNSSLLIEAIKFASTVPPETPYAELTRTAFDAGWVWYLRQTETLVVSGGNFLVSFDVMLGKDADSLAVVDTISVQVSGSVGPISTQARGLAQASLVHLFFGRLPPAEPERPNRAGLHRAQDEEPEDRYPDTQTDEPPLAIVERRTPDGLPLFVDLYALGGVPGTEVVDAVIDVIAETLPGLTTVAALIALGTHNAEAIQYVQDLGTNAQRQELKRMIDTRKSELESADVAPRRRAPQRV